MGKCICILEEGQEITMDEGCWTILSLKRECDRYYLEAWGDEKVDKRINYCPMCGRRLNGE